MGAAERRKIEAGQWNEGYWDVPYQQEAEAVEQAFRLVELCMKSFQRAARQLANIRLVRAKTARARRRDRVRTLKPVNVACDSRFKQLGKDPNDYIDDDKS